MGTLRPEVCILHIIINSFCGTLIHLFKARRSVNGMNEQRISYGFGDKHSLVPNSCLDSNHVYCV